MSRQVINCVRCGTRPYFIGTSKNQQWHVGCLRCHVFTAPRRRQQKAAKLWKLLQITAMLEGQAMATRLGERA